jgi:di/tricarboxylate transporter
LAIFVATIIGIITKPLPMGGPMGAIALFGIAATALTGTLMGFLSNLFSSLTHYGSGPAPVLFGSGYVELGTWWKFGGADRRHKPSDLASSRWIMVEADRPLVVLGLNSQRRGAI